MTQTVAEWGGLFAVFTFVHFVVDWGFQTHWEAMNKSKSAKVRALHCAIYTAGFLPLMWLLDFEAWKFAAGAAVLFLSHFFEDTYIPVYLWAKHVRRIPEIRERGIEAFIEQFKTPLGLVLFITVDQIIHLMFLWVLVWLARF